MQIRISSPRHYESIYGASDFVRAYLDQVEKKVGEAFAPQIIDILRISLLIAPPEELAQGKFLEYEKFDWRYGYVAVGVNGDFERHHLGDDFGKISELSKMHLDAFLRISKKKKAKFDCRLASEIVIHITQTFEEAFRNMQAQTEM